MNFILIAVVCFAFTHCFELTAQVGLPEYKFVLGSELTFQANETLSANQQEHKNSMTWKVIAAKEQVGGLWRLLFAFGNVQDPNWLSEERGIYWLYTDVTNKGMFEAKTSDQNWISPTLCFPRLPDQEIQLKLGWDSPAVDSEFTQFKLIPRSPNEANWFKFRGMTYQPLDKLFDAKSEVFMRFPLDLGMVVRHDYRKSRNSYADGKAVLEKLTGTTDLINVRQLDAKWIRTFSHEQKIYFEALAQWRKALREAEHNPQKTSTIIQNAVTELVNTTKSLKTPSLVYNLQALIHAQNQHIDRVKKIAEQKSKWIARPAPTWEIRLKDGFNRRLTEFRGRVTILSFWKSDSDICLEELALLQSLSNKYSRFAPNVVALNCDEVPEDADFVLGKLNLNMNHLPGEKVKQKYNITQFPTTIVLDQHGIVLDYIEGSFKKSREDLFYILDKEFRIRR